MHHLLFTIVVPNFLMHWKIAQCVSDEQGDRLMFLFPFSWPRSISFSCTGALFCQFWLSWL